MKRDQRSDFRMAAARGNLATHGRWIGPILTAVAIAVILIVQIASVLSPASVFPLLLYGYLVLVYAILSTLIWIEHQNLGEFHVDRFTLFTLTLSCFLRRRLGVPGESYILLIIAFVGVSLLLFLILKNNQIPRTSLRSAVWGLIAGIACLVPIGAVEWLSLSIMHAGGWGGRATPGLGPIPLFGAREFIYVLSFGVPLEELLFRGFLSGYLRRAGYSEERAAWLQGLANWLLHWNQIVRPIVLFLGIPLILWLSSWLAARTKQLFPSIAAHLVLDAVTGVI